MNTEATVSEYPVQDDLIWDTLSKLLDMLGCTEDATYTIARIMIDDIILFDSKQRDYGENNISKFGEFGILVRASDKLERLTTLLQSGRLPNNESVEDSWQDLALYSTIARAVRSGTW